MPKKAKAAKVETAKKAPKPKGKRPGGKVVQMDLFRAGPARKESAPQKESGN